MKHFFTLIIILCCFPFLGSAQTVILDWETAGTSADFSYFGSTLDGTPTMAIPNPDMSGINTSATVMQMDKPADGETWAGAFGDPPTSMDFINGGDICLKMWAMVPFEILLKLEMSTTGGGDWENQMTHPGGSTWVELCWDSSQPSAAAGNLAMGNVYSRLTLFPGFGSPGSIQYGTVYIDDVVVDSSIDYTEYNADFTVDMSNYTDAFSTVFVKGTFNNWSEDNPMTDNGDGTWSTTIPMMSGAYEYKYSLDTSVEEEFPSTSECTITTGGYTNRTFNIAGADNSTSACWNSCYGCSEAVSITWLLNMSTVDTISDDGVYLAGGEYFGHGDFPMTDDDGDGIYAITIERGMGFTTDFTFLNGICLPDWSCKEDIAGQDCAVDPYNDRRLEDVQSDLVYATCYGVCSVTTDCVVGIDDFSFGSISVYPTLASESINVNLLSDRVNSAQYQMVNLQGSLVATGTIQEGHNIIETSAFPSGMYIIQFEAEGTQFSQSKVIIE